MSRQKIIDGLKEAASWPMLAPAMKVSEHLKDLSDRKLPHEILRLDDGTSTIIIDIDGTDYGLTMMKVPRQRARPATQ